MLSHSLTNFEIQKCYQNDFYLRNSLPKIKDRAYVINGYEFKSIGIKWIALCENGDNLIYFDSFGVEHILKEI